MHVPTEMKTANRWVLWKYEADKKPPVDIQGHKVDITNPQNWLTFDEAVKALSTGGFSGVGFVLGDGFAGIDLDDCLDQGGNLKQWARGLIRLLPLTYAEISPSGRGVKLFFKTDVGITLHQNRKGGVEIYTSKRYFTVTGKKLPEAPQTLATIDPELLNRLADNLHVIEIAQKIEEGEAGEDLQALFLGDWKGYTSQSEADLAFVSMAHRRYHLSRGELDFLYRISALYRKKWDESHSADGRTYAELTIEKVLNNTQQKAPTILPVLSLVQAVERELAQGRDSWRIDRFLPECGFAIFASRPKLGKTETLLKIASDIITGTPCFGRETQGGAILWITAEDKNTRIQEGLLRYGVDPALLDKCFVVDFEALNKPITAEDIVETARTLKINTVFIEPLAILREIATLGRRGNLSYEALYDVILPILRKAKNAGVLLVGVWHTPKGKTYLQTVADLVDAPLGSTAYSAVADSIVALGLPPSANSMSERRIIATGRGVELDYLLKWNGTQYEEASELQQEIFIITRERKEILQAILHLGDQATPLKIAEATGKSHTTVKVLLSKLRTAGLVASHNGVYELTEISKTAIEGG